MVNDKRRHLAEEAGQLRKAWLFTVALAGMAQQLTPKELVLPDYSCWTNKMLKRQIVDLQVGLNDILNRLVLNWKANRARSVTPWLSDHFDKWKEARFGLYDVGRLHEVEHVLGKLLSVAERTKTSEL